jgi:hypothetical protein
LFEFQARAASGGNNYWLDNDFDNGIGDLTVFWGFYSNNFSLFGGSRYFMTAKVAAAFETGDPRIAGTLNMSDRTINKYVTMDNTAGGGVGSSDNYRILRLADVKLLTAEALLQSGGSTVQAIGLINEVRTRARNMVNGGLVPANYSTAETNTATIFNWINNERLIELAGEGQRWFDLRRWHIQGLITLDNNYFSSNVGVGFNPAKNLVVPIPTSELDVNPNVQQNPGY